MHNLLLLIAVPSSVGRYSTTALSPFFYILAGDWAILIAGVIGGTAALFLQLAQKASQVDKQDGKS